MSKQKPWTAQHLANNLLERMKAEASRCRHPKRAGQSLCVYCATMGLARAFNYWVTYPVRFDRNTVLRLARRKDFLKLMAEELGYTP